MSTRSRFRREEITIGSKFFSTTRTIIETTFYGNNVTTINDLKEIYQLALKSPGTIVTDIDVYKPEEIGLSDGTKVLIFNDGNVSGRAASARRIAGLPNVNVNQMRDIIKEAIYRQRKAQHYHSESYIGLDPDFMVKAHLLMPAGDENLIYSWLLNFQYLNDFYTEMYGKSKVLPNEADIMIYSDPSWENKDFPMGLAFFEPESNCACILGMRYFGEHKKGTLTLAWNIANRNGYLSCHGGLKRFGMKDGSKYVSAFFGLSGSGKSTLTHAVHGDKYDITILHDDAFIISVENGSTVALEPAYFDKTQDYASASPVNKFLLTAQNIGATLDENGKIVPVTEDIRNGNGRAVKSRLWSPNRVDKFDEPINAVFWLMKDPSFPPILKITNPELAAALGATLATKRTSAERLSANVNINDIVIEPYANPFRTYKLSDDYDKFIKLFTERRVECFILNTGDFCGKKITPQVTLSCIERVVDSNASFKKWGVFENIQALDIEGFNSDFSNRDYTLQLRERLNTRVEFLYQKSSEIHGLDRLPIDAVNSVEKLISELNAYI